MRWMRKSVRWDDEDAITNTPVRMSHIAFDVLGPEYHFR
jgi:hypothetical protein